MRTINVRAYPYAFQQGKIVIPDDVTDVDSYLINHWDDIEFDEPDLDYCGTDFEYDE